MFSFAVHFRFHGLSCVAFSFFEVVSSWAPLQLVAGGCVAAENYKCEAAGAAFAALEAETSMNEEYLIICVCRTCCDSNSLSVLNWRPDCCMGLAERPAAIAVTFFAFCVSAQSSCLFRIAQNRSNNIYDNIWYVAIVSHTVVPFPRIIYWTSAWSSLPLYTHKPKKSHIITSVSFSDVKNWSPMSSVCSACTPQFPASANAKALSKHQTSPNHFP